MKLLQQLRGCLWKKFLLNKVSLELRCAKYEKAIYLFLSRKTLEDIYFSLFSFVLENWVINKKKTSELKDLLWSGSG